MYELLKWAWRQVDALWKGILAIAGLAVAIWALWISIQVYELTNIQFKENQRTSDSIFQIQINTQRQLSDSLIQQIEDLQKITSQQLKVSSKQKEMTEKQLEVMIKTLREEKYKGRPQIVFGLSFIKDTLKKEEERIFSPTIRTHYQNVGNRFALNTRFRAFVIYDGFKHFSSGELTGSRAETIETDAIIANEFKPTILAEFKEEFYYCFEVIYYDKGLDETFRQANYSKYYKSRGEYGFYLCKDDIKEKLKNRINLEMRKHNLPIFDQ